MTEYIEKNKAIKELYEVYDYEFPTASGGFDEYARMIVPNTIKNMPAADVAPVRHGRWDSVKNPQWPAYSHDKCSICGWWNTKNALCYDGNKKPGHGLNYCPNCGAKMDGGTN